MSSFPDHLHALLYPRAYPHPVRAVDLTAAQVAPAELVRRIRAAVPHAVNE
jgi:hypothetical protein